MRRDRFGRRDLRRARRQIGIEQVRGRGGPDPPGLLHRLVFGEELERHRVRTADQLIEKYLELAARTVDQVTCGLRFLRRQFLDADQLALDFIGVRGNRVESHHLNRTGRLVHMGSRLLERGGIARRVLVRSQRLQSAGKGVVDLYLDPSQRAEIEIGCSVDGQGFACRLDRASTRYRVIARKNRADNSPRSRLIAAACAQASQNTHQR